MADDGGLGQLALQLERGLAHQVEVARSIVAASGGQLGFTTLPAVDNWLHVTIVGIKGHYTSDKPAASIGSGYNPAEYGVTTREALRGEVARILTGQGLTDYGQTPVPLFSYRKHLPY